MLFIRWAESHIEAHPDLFGVLLHRSTIWRILNEQNLKPHRSKYFLQITDPDFFPKMEHLIQVYVKTKKNLFCYDECTGIQILLRIAPNVRPEMSKDKLKGWLEEFEYIRNGTTDLLAFLNVKTGKVNVSCKPDHTKTTFISTFKEHVSTIPKEERIDYIMDNLASHYSFDFCKVVAKLSNVICPPEANLKTGNQRREWLQSENKRIVVHFTPFHGSWLNMVEIWFGILGSKCLKESYASPDDICEAIYSFAEMWDNYLSHSFEWKYDGRGMHRKVVNRFINFLTNSSKKLHIKFLTKKLLLMTNMLEQYRDKVPEKYWKKLRSIFYEKYKVLLDGIEHDEKPKRKKKAKEALRKLFVALSKGFDQNEKFRT